MIAKGFVHTSGPAVVEAEDDGVSVEGPFETSPDAKGAFFWDEVFEDTGLGVEEVRGQGGFFAKEGVADTGPGIRDVADGIAGEGRLDDDTTHQTKAGSSSRALSRATLMP